VITLLSSSAMIITFSAFAMMAILIAFVVVAILVTFAVVTILITLAVVAIFTTPAWLTRMIMVTLSIFTVVATLVWGRPNGTVSTRTIGISAVFVRTVSLLETEEIGSGPDARSGSGAGPCVTVPALHLHKIHRSSMSVSVREEQTYADDNSVFLARNSERDRKTLYCRESRDDGKCLKCSQAHR
jgi:hypothetical protein